LTVTNAAKFKSREDMMVAVRAATIIGTLQASYMTMPYLGWVSEELARRDALIGVSMTGMFDSPEVALDPECQREAAEMAKKWNREYAAKLGIASAARATVLKPEGTSSLELGGVASGHHAHHARRYIRRVTADELEHVFQAFRAVNPHMCVRKPDGKWVIEFPVEAPPNAILKEDVRAIPFLEMVKSTQQNWVIPGTARDDGNPGLTNNVSNTVVVREEEWEDVAEYLWNNRAFFTGVSMLPATGDKAYAFAPFEAITTPADESRWNAILASYQPVDYSAMVETDDTTTLKGEVACAGGACAIV
jgi:ribonucleoside-diphosphate reductase alpha chain